MAVDIDVGAVRGHDGEVSRDNRCWIALIEPFDDTGHQPRGFTGFYFLLQSIEVDGWVAHGLHGELKATLLFRALVPQPGYHGDDLRRYIS